MPVHKKKSTISAPASPPVPARFHIAPWIWIAIGLLALPIRFWLWRRSIGSNDVHIWLDHAQRVAADGLAHTYTTHPTFNHPPLAGLYSVFAHLASAGNLWTFAQLLKLPGVFGEALSLAALWRFAGPGAFAAYAWAPAAILVSSYHGSTDALCTAFLLLAGIAFDRERFLAAGLFFGASLNVKMLPVVLLPLLFANLRSRRAALHVALGLAIMALPFVPSLVADAPAMYRNMFQYNSNPDPWGVLAFLNDGMNTPEIAASIAPIREWYLAKGRYVLLSAIVLLGALSLVRHTKLADQFAMGTALFLIFAPGFGVQYVMYAAPLLMLYSVRAGLLWGFTAGAFVGMVYWIYLHPGMPLVSVIFRGFPGPAPLLGVIAWTVLIFYVSQYLARSWRQPLDPAPWIPAKAVSMFRYRSRHV